MSVERIVTIANRRGLHARASAKFVNLAERFDADIQVTGGDGCQPETVCGTSIMGLMMLAAGLGQTIRIEATGPDAEDAVAALSGLVDAKFDED